MTSNRIAVLLAAAMAFTGALSAAQSLGDVARQERQKQQAKDAQASKPAPKVITNEDLPESSEDDEDQDSENQPSERQRNDRLPFTPSTPSDPHGAERWKTKIQAEKNAIDSLQGEIEKLKSSVHYVESNRYSNGVAYNQEQSRKQSEVERLQKKLEEEKKKLEDMQDAARKAGFGSSVYDP